MNDLVEVTDLCRSFKDGTGENLTVLQNINLQVLPGQTIAIVGQSGSGKSVFLNLLGGMDKPTSGKISFCGTSIFQYDAVKLAEWRNENLGFVFQFSPLVRDFTVLENVMLPCLIAGQSWSVACKKAKQELQWVGLSNRINFLAKQLSGGEQQRVAIARALINKPQIILADEPTGNLDPQTGQSVITLLKEQVNRVSTALVIVTHNEDIAKHMHETWRLQDNQLHRIS